MSNTCVSVYLIVPLLITIILISYVAILRAIIMNRLYIIFCLFVVFNFVLAILYYMYSIPLPAFIKICM